MVVAFTLKKHAAGTSGTLCQSSIHIKKWECTLKSGKKLHEMSENYTEKKKGKQQ